MSTLKVEVVEIEKVENHPNADRLDLVTIKGWQVVTGRDTYEKGDRVIYIPIDSMLPTPVAELLFPPDSKIKPGKGGRIRTIKIRGAISQGMIADPQMFGIRADLVPLGHDVTKDLGITKYEPPVVHGGNGIGNAMSAPKRDENPNFKKYTGLENFKNYPGVFTPGELVSVTEKIHGTNFRAGWVPTVADTLWKKIKKLFGLLPQYEFVYGSHNRQLQNKQLYTGFYEENVYSEAVVKYRLREILPKGVVVYGEVYGDKIQKNYSYGCRAGERKLVLFDVMVDGKYVDPDEARRLADQYGLPFVPELFEGHFDLDAIKKLATGSSVMVPSQKVIEGVVIKPIAETETYMGRKVLKLINDEYLLKDQTEFH